MEIEVVVDGWPSPGLNRGPPEKPQEGSEYLEQGFVYLYGFGVIQKGTKTIILTTTHIVYTWALKLLYRNPFKGQVYKGSEELLVVFP